MTRPIYPCSPAVKPIIIGNDRLNEALFAQRLFMPNVIRAPEYIGPMAIVSYRDREAERLSTTGTSRKYAAIARIAPRKLRMLEAATSRKDLRSPPGNRLEPLAGDRVGQYSIRINEQFRICFGWSEAGAVDVESVDCH